MDCVCPSIQGGRVSGFCLLATVSVAGTDARLIRVLGALRPPLARVPDAHCPISVLPQKVLRALDSTWTTMEFEHEPHPRTGTMMLKADEVLVETLEDNQVQLQNLMMSKYLSHFLKEVTSWQQKLSTADSVISIWFEVQRTWSHLESIFIGSEDIRAQLPEDSLRFDTIDLEFKVSPALRSGALPGHLGQKGAPDTSAIPSSSQALMEDAVKTPNVVEATNKPGLYNKLEALKKRWVPTHVQRCWWQQEPGACATCWPAQGKAPVPGLVKLPLPGKRACLLQRAQR